MNFEQNFSPLDTESSEYQSLNAENIVQQEQSQDITGDKKPKAKKKTGPVPNEPVKTIPGTSIPMGVQPILPKPSPLYIVEQAISNSKSSLDNLNESTKPIPYMAPATSLDVEQRKKIVQDAENQFIQAKNIEKSVLAEHRESVIAPVDKLISSGEWEKFFDKSSGAFKYSEALSYFDKEAKNNGGGTFVRETMLADFKKRAQQKYDEKVAKPFIQEEIKKSGVPLDDKGSIDFSKIGIDINKYGEEILKSLSPEQQNNIELIKNTAEAKIGKSLELAKSAANELNTGFSSFVSQMQSAVQSGQMSAEDANNQIQQKKSELDIAIANINDQYQKDVRAANVSATGMFSRIQKELETISGKISFDEIVKNFSPEDKKKYNEAISKINAAYQNGLNRSYESKEAGKKVIEGMLPTGALFGKSLISGWNQGVASIGGYLNMVGYDNSFIDYLRGAQQTSEEYATAQYKWNGKEWTKRAITSTGTSVGASLPIMAPTIAVSATGMPEIPAAFLSGYLGYLGERMQNTDEVYKKELERTGSVSEAYKSAKKFENLSTVELPFHFLGGFGAMKLINAGKFAKGAAVKAATGIVAEEAEEIPTEYIQGYNQAKVEGYKKSFTTFVKENPEIGYDTFIATIGQSGAFYGAGKALGVFNKDVASPTTQFYTDIIQKNGVDYAKAVALKFYQSGVINDKTLNDVVQTIGKISNTTQSLNDLNMDENASKLFIALNFDAADMKKYIAENKDGELTPIYEQRLKDIKSQIANLSNGTLPYVVFTLPGGVKSSRVMSLEDFNKLERSGNHIDILKASDSVEVVNNEEENSRIKDMKSTVGNFENVPSGFYQNESSLTEEESKRKAELESALDAPNLEKGTVTVGSEILKIEDAKKELDNLTTKSIEYATQESKVTEQKGLPEGGVSEYQGAQAVQEQATNEADTSNRPVSSETKVITSQNIDEIDSLPFTGVQRKVLDDAKRLFVSIGTVVEAETGSKLNVKIHTPETFKQAVIDAGGTAQDAQNKAFYMSTDGSIHLNMENVSSDTMLHEGFHPVLDYMAANKPDIIDGLFTQLESVKGAESFVNRAKIAYEADGDVTIKKEAITDFIASVANGTIKIDATNFDRIKSFVVDMLRKIGFDISNPKIVNLENAQQLKDLSKFITEKFQKGEEIKTSELGVFTESTPTAEVPIAKSGQLQFSKTIYGSSGIEKIPALDKNEFKKDVESGRISVTNPYESLRDKFFAITFPDDLFTGEINVNGVTVAYGSGGVFYVAKFGRDGNAWASVGKNSANNFVKQANESLEKNNGDGIVVLSKGDDIKHATSLQAKVAFINTLLKYAESKNDSSGIVKAIRNVYNVGNAKNPSKIIEYFNNYLASGRMESGQTMFDAKGSFNNLMTEIIKQARPVISNMFIDMGLEGEKFFDKTQLKKGNKLATIKGLSTIYADMLQEDFLKDAPKGGIYAAIRFNSPLEYVVDKSHPSYPFVIRTKDGSPVRLEVFNKTFNSYGDDVAVTGVERNEKNAFGVVTTTKPNFKINQDMEGNKSEHSLNDKLNGYEAISGSKKPQFQKNIVPFESNLPEGPQGPTPTGEVATTGEEAGAVQKYEWESFAKEGEPIGEQMIKTSTGRYVATETMRGQIMDRERTIKEVEKAKGSWLTRLLNKTNVGILDNQYNVLQLLKQVGKAGQLVGSYLVTRNSASATALPLSQAAIDDIYGPISKKKMYTFGGQQISEYALFNQVISYQRVISIQNQMNQTYRDMIEAYRSGNINEYNKNKQRLIDNGMLDMDGKYLGENLETEFGMGQITASQAYKLLQEVREKVGESEFEKLMTQSKKYSDFFNSMMRARMDAGLISPDVYEYLSRFFYAPTRYISSIVADPILSMSKTSTSYRNDRTMKIKELAGGSERLNMSDYEGLIKAVVYASEYAIAENRTTNRFFNLVSENKENFENNGIRLGIEYVPIEEKGSIQVVDAIDMNAKLIAEGKAPDPTVPSLEGRKQLPYKGVEKYKERGVPQVYTPSEETYTDEKGNRFKVVQVPLKAGEAYIKTYFNGQRRDIIVPEWFAEAWNNDNFKNSSTLSFIGKITGANVLRVVATGINPVFGVAQLIPDTISAYAATVGERKNIPLLIDYPIFFAKVLSAARDIKNNSKDYIEANKYGATTNFYNGGSVTFERGLLGQEDKSLEKLIEEWNVPGLKQYIIGSKKITETTEQMTKVALYKSIRDAKIAEYKSEFGKEPTGQDLEDIRIESAFLSRSTADFHRKGTWGSELNKVIPYLNAAIQVQRAVLKSAKENKTKTLYRSMEFLAYGSLLWATAAGAFDDDDELREKKRLALAKWSEFDRTNRVPIFFVESKGRFISIKLPEFLVPFNVLSGKSVERGIIEKNSDYTNVEMANDIKEATKAVIEEFPVTQFINLEKVASRNPMYSAMSKLLWNRDPYKQEDVVAFEEMTKDYLEGARIGERRAGEIYQKVGSAVKNPFIPEGLSPKRLESAVNSIPFQNNPFSGVLIYATEMSSSDKKLFEERYGKNALEQILKASGISQRYFKEGSKVNQSVIDLAPEEIKDRGEFMESIKKNLTDKFDSYSKGMSRFDAWNKVKDEYISEFKKLDPEQQKMVRSYIFGDFAKMAEMGEQREDPMVNQIINIQTSDAKIDAIIKTLDEVKQTDSSKVDFLRQLFDAGLTRSKDLQYRLNERGMKITGSGRENPYYEPSVGYIRDRILEYAREKRSNP